MAEDKRLPDLGTGDLTQTDFMIKDVKFSIVKMKSMKGWKVLEQIRHTLGREGIKIDPGLDDGNAFLATVIESIIKLDPEFTEWLRTQLFLDISFEIKGTTSFQKLHGAEDIAFEHLEPYHIYEIMMRGLAVNFTSSFQEIESKIFAIQGRKPPNS